MRKISECNCNHEKVGIANIPNEEVLDKMTIILKIAGDKTRLKILYSLLAGSKCVCEIQEDICASQSLVSHQLKILRNNNLVKTIKKGNHVFYSLSDAHVVALLSLVHEHATEDKKYEEGL